MDSLDIIRMDRPTAIYVIPHQDDELLTCGAGIMEDVASGMGVMVVIMTRGEASGTRRGGSLTNWLGYTPTEAEFSAARDREFRRCVKKLKAEPVVFDWSERMGDGVATHEGIKDLLKKRFTSGASLRATAPSDYHNDHRECGVAIQELADEGWGRDPRMMLSSERYVSHAPPGVEIKTMGGKDWITRDIAEPYIKQDYPSGHWGIGYRSVSSSFNYMLDEDSTTYYYRG